MSVSRQDEAIIEGTARFFKKIQSGLQIPADIQQGVTRATGFPENSDPETTRHWEIVVVGTIAHEVSRILGTFPVVILDYNPSEERTSRLRVGNYVYEKTKRPKKRPKPPHRITDREIIRVATSNMMSSLEDGRVVICPMIANFENRSVFEIALVTVFPTWGAYAFRTKTNVSGRHNSSMFRRIIRFHNEHVEKNFPEEDDPLALWIFQNIPGIGKYISDMNYIEETAINNCSSEAIYLLESLAEKYRK